MVDILQQRAAFSKFAQTVQPDCIEARKNITPFTVPWRMAVLFDEFLDILEASDNAGLAWRAGRNGFADRLDAQIREEFGVGLVSHPRLPFAEGK
jgi:hypothetical protein